MTDILYEKSLLLNQEQVHVEVSEEDCTALTQLFQKLSKEQLKRIMAQIESDVGTNEIDYETVENTDERIRLLFKALKRNGADLKENVKELYPSSRAMI